MKATDITRYYYQLYPKESDATGVNLIQWMHMPRKVTTEMKLRTTFNYNMLKQEDGTKIPLSVFIFKFKDKRAFDYNRKYYRPASIAYELVTDKEKRETL